MLVLTETELWYNPGCVHPEKISFKSTGVQKKCVSYVVLAHTPNNYEVTPSTPSQTTAVMTQQLIHAETLFFLGVHRLVVIRVLAASHLLSFHVIHHIVLKYEKSS